MLFALYLILVLPAFVGVILLMFLWLCRSADQGLCDTDALSSKRTLTSLVVLGSGGHTTEILRIVGVLPMDVYTPRIYVNAESDGMSGAMAEQMERDRVQLPQSTPAAGGGGERHLRRGSGPSISREEVAPTTYRFASLPRAREVRQSYVSAVLTTFWSLLAAVPLVWGAKADLVLCTGPGTCLPICIVAWTFRLLRLKACAIVFVESVCRVKTLSLCGRIVYHLRLADRVLVQWPRLKNAYPRTEYVGRIS
jgi:beta-1,4-N-acetylglucosaminyltransferase